MHKNEILEYRSLSDEEFQELAKILPADRYFTGDQINPDYHHDELAHYTGVPQAVMQVVTEEEVSRIMRFAYHRNIPVVARGTATGLVGSAVAIYGGIIIDTTLMDKVIELDEENMCITVEPGMLLMDLLEYCKKNNYLYPPDPGEKSATIGGNISTNAGGMRAVRYGVTRDYVLGLHVVLADGEVLHLGGKIVKNSSGYSLKDMIIGSEGTLGIITQATLKLLPLPQYSISLLVPFPNIAMALETVPAIIQSNTNPTAIEFMERATILFSEDFLGKNFPDSKNDAYLLMTFDAASKAEAEMNYEKVAELCLERGAVDCYIVDTDERKDTVWSARGSFLEGIKASAGVMDECDVVVPRTKIAEFIAYTHKLSEELDVRLPSFGHAGDGNLHVYICKDSMDDERFEYVLDQAFEGMYNKAKELGGQVSGEHGIGYAKTSYLESSVGNRQMEIMDGIKHVFDPKGILNPGKVVGRN